MHDVLCKIAAKILNKYDFIGIYSVFGVYYLYTSVDKEGVDLGGGGGG